MGEDEARVVVVDDVADIADALAFALEQDGYKVWVAYDGLQALALIEEHQPHCVVFDINMPSLDHVHVKRIKNAGMRRQSLDGSELSKRLRERYGDDLVLIAITGWSETDSRVADAFARVDHYLKKPVDPAVLRKVMPPV